MSENGKDVCEAMVNDDLAGETQWNCEKYTCSNATSSAVNFT
jgi:hypothetical protein